MARTIAAVALFLPFLAYLFGNKRVKSVALFWLCFSEAGNSKLENRKARINPPQRAWRSAGSSRVSIFRVSIFDLPVSRFPIQQSAKTNEFLAPNRNYL